jgi:hypothetical protein
MMEAWRFTAPTASLWMPEMEDYLVWGESSNQYG